MYYERNGPLARCVRRNVANEWERTMEVCVRYLRYVTVCVTLTG